MFCSKCGTRLNAMARFCDKCGTRVGIAAPTAAPLYSNVGPPPQIVVVRSGKSAGLAAVLSFFWCGLGQIYNGQIGKGLLFGFLYFISFLLIFAAIGIVTTPILWIWGMVDAYQTSERINAQSGTY